MTSDDCLFCKMAGGTFAVDKLYDDGVVFAIADIAPRAPTHIILITKQHIESARELTAEQAPLIGQMITAAQDLARKAGVFDSGYRLAINAGGDGGQTIFHLHMHLLGGHKLGPEG